MGVENSSAFLVSSGEGVFKEKADIFAQDAIDAFARVTHELSEIREAHQDISLSLTEFSQLVSAGEDAGEKMSMVQQGVAQMRAAMAQYTTVVQSPESNKYFQAGHSYVCSIGLFGKTLAAIATLTRTTVASLGITTLDRYLEGLKTTADDLQGASERVGCHLVDLRRRSRTGAGDCVLAQDALENVATAIEQGRAVLERLETNERHLVQELTETTGFLEEKGRSQLKGFVSAMQFSDRLAQRLDHVGLMLGREDGDVGRLAAAQISGAVADIRDVSAEVRGTMRALAEIGTSGAALFSKPHVTNVISEALQTREDLVQKILGDLIQADQVMQAVRDNVQAGAEIAQSAGVSFDDLVFSANDLALAAVNSLLLATRSGDDAQPLVVLSAEVRATAAECLIAVDRGRNTLDQILTRQSDVASPLIAASDHLQTGVTDYDGQIQVGQSRLEKIHRLQSTAADKAQALVAMTEAVNGAMGAMDAVAADLENLSDELAQACGPIEPEDEVLRAVYASYTMDEERICHRDIYPDTVPDETQLGEGASDGDDLDDIFF